MRLKKLLSVVTAAAVALSAVIAAPVNLKKAEAAEKAIDMSGCEGYYNENSAQFKGCELWDGTVSIPELANATKISVTFTVKNRWDASTEGITAVGRLTDSDNTTISPTIDNLTLGNTYTMDFDTSSDSLDPSNLHYFGIEYKKSDNDNEWNLLVTDVTIKATFADEELEPGTLYKQSTAVTDGTYSTRFVQLISEDDANAASEVSFTLNNGTSDAVKTSTKCYTSVSAAGDTIIAPDGYVFVAYAITGIPEGITITASCELNQY